MKTQTEAKTQGQNFILLRGYGDVLFKRFNDNHHNVLHFCGTLS